MGNVSKNLNRSEFECQCGCGFDTVDIELIPALQDVVDHFAAKHSAKGRINITGGNRCQTHNTWLRVVYNQTGGQKGAKTAVKSRHINGNAADFKIYVRISGEWVQIAPDAVADYLDKKYSSKYGIGRYSNRTHFDTRTDGPARWGKRYDQGINEELLWPQK